VVNELHNTRLGARLFQMRTVQERMGGK